ncbi:MAG: helical backbone metal receptor [Gemmatimonadota bacterium]
MIRAALFGALVLAAGCRSEPAPAPAAITFLGPDGQPVTLAQLPVSRIVSTNQAATDWLVRLGAADRLVARTDFDKQPALAALPSIGGGLETSAEVIAALHPDVLLAWRNGSSVGLAKALAQFSIPVIAVEVTDTAEVFAQLETIGRLIGNVTDADWAAETLRGELDSLRYSACADDRHPESVVIETWDSPPNTAGASAWMSQLLAGACLTNIFADVDVPWPVVSMETIAARHPRWVLTSTGSPPDGRLAALRKTPGWRELEAVKAGRVIEIDPDIFSRAGPGLADWIRAVRAARDRIEEGG